MPSNHLTDEQIRLRDAIHQRRCTLNGRLLTPFAIFLFCLVGLTFFQSTIPVNWAFPLLIVVGFSVMGRIHRSITKNIARQLSPEEIETIKLSLYNCHDYDERYELESVVKMYHKVNRKEELLRPSQPTQDDTLLRAATSTDITPQDQLLRPDPTDEEM